MQLKFVLPVLAALVPLVVSTSVARTTSPACQSNEFKWEEKDCCLPVGGPPSPPPPPKDTQCPPTSYYWEPKQGCCAPRNLPPKNPPPPQCPKNWEWNSATHRCTYSPPTPSSPPPSRPSSVAGYPGQGNGQGNGYGSGHDNNGHYRKRAAAKARTTLCPTGLDACPISSLSADYECLDTSVELEACGGCPALGQGQDCTKIEGAWNVGCEQGSCHVYTCAGGFHIGADGKSCLPA
ncbi:protein priA [Pholiota molesta]|nr:protein priA [Pholiota molesta]